MAGKVTAGIDVPIKLSGLSDLEKAYQQTVKTTSSMNKLLETIQNPNFKLDFGTRSLEQVRSVDSALTNVQNKLRSITSDIRTNSNLYREQGNSIAELTAKINASNDKTKDVKSSLESSNKPIKDMVGQMSNFTEKMDSLIRLTKSNNENLARSNVSLNETKTLLYSNFSQLNNIAEVNRAIYVGQGRQTMELRNIKSDLGGVKSSVDSIYEQQEKSVAEIKKLNSEIDLSKSRLTSVNEISNKVKNSEKQTTKQIEANQAQTSRWKDKLQGVQDVADNTSNIFGKMVGANLVSNGIQNTMASITNSIHQARDAVVDYNGKQQTMNATWDTLTGSAKKGQGMVDVGNQLSTAYGQDIDVVDELNQKFYHVYNNKEQTEQLSKSVLTLGDTLGMTGADIQRFGENFTHMMTSSKLQMGDFNHISDQLPMFGENLLDYEKKIQNNSALTMGELQKQMSAGKISSQDAENVINELGGKYQEASENLMKTMPGMTRAIKAQIPKLMNDIYSPFANMKNPLFEQVSNWVRDGKTESEFKSLGDNIAKQMDRITKAFDIKNVNVTGGLDGMVNGINKGVTNLANTIIKNKDSIKGLFKTIGEAGSGSFKVFVETLKIMAPILKVTAELAAKHPKIFASLTLAMIGASKATSTFVGAVRGVDAIKDTISGVKKLTSATGKLKISGGKNIKSFSNKVTDMSKKSVSSLKKLAKQGASSIASLAKAVGKASLSVIKSMAKMALAFATNPFGMITLAIGAVIGGLVLLYQHFKPFRDLVNGIGKQISKIFGGVIKFFKNNWKEIGLFMLNPFAGVAGLLVKHVKLFQDFANKVKNIFNTSFGRIGKDFGKFFNNLKKLFGDSLKLISQIWNGNWSGAYKTVGKITKDIQKVIGSYFKVIKDLFSGSMKFVEGIWKASWEFIADIGKSIWNGIKSFFTGAWDNFKKLFKIVLDATVDVWKDRWNAVVDFGKSIWDGIHKTFTGFVDGIKDIWNKVTDFIGKAWSNMWDGVINSAKSAVYTVKKVVADIANSVINPINSMLDKIADGINWILDKVGSKGIGHFDIPLVKYANGTPDNQQGHQGGLAMVNDGGGANYREMYKLPTGQVGMFPAKRNMVVTLPKGTSVLDGEKSSLLAKRMGLPTYANGIGDFFGGIWNGAKDIFDDVENIMKNPAKFMESTLNHFMGGMSSNVKLASNVMTSFPKKLAENSVDWIKKQFQDMQEPAGTGVERWRSTIQRALGMNGLPTTDNYVNAWLKQIATESSGNAKAVQGDIGDVNNASGDLAKGLLQTISSTFNAYAFPGHKNVFNGFDNALSAINYAKSAYGSDMLGVIGHGHGYANGGIVNKHQVAEVAEGNQKEAIVPIGDKSKRPRALQVLADTVRELKPNQSEKDTITGESATNSYLNKDDSFYLAGSNDKKATTSNKVTNNKRGGNTNVTINPTININVEGKVDDQTTQNIGDEMNRHLEQFADQLRQQLGGNLGGAEI